MNLKTNLTLAAALISSMALVGCDQAGTGKVNLNLQASNAAAPAAKGLMARTATAEPVAVHSIDVKGVDGLPVGTLDVTRAVLVVGEIELEHESEDDAVEDDEIEFEGPFIVDLIAGKAYPELPAANVDAGFYKDIELDLVALPQADIDLLNGAVANGLPHEFVTGLAEISLLIEGEYTANTEGAVAQAFKFEVKEDHEVELSAPGVETNGFVVDESTLNNVIVDFRMDEWFRFDNIETNPNLVAAFTDLNGDILISKEDPQTAAIWEVLFDNIEESAEYGEDDNDDGELSDDEDDDK